MTTNLYDKLKGVKALFFDMDGVFTNGKVTVMPDGDLIRDMHVRDGFALKLLHENGFIVSIVSAGYSVGAIKRFEKFGVQHIKMDSSPKLPDLLEIMEVEGLQDQDVLYMGDDVADLECLDKAGISICPNDAVAEVQEICDYVCKAKGGEAAVRELVEILLRAQDKWPY